LTDAAKAEFEPNYRIHQWFWTYQRQLNVPKELSGEKEDICRRMLSGETKVGLQWRLTFDRLTQGWLVAFSV